MRRSSGMPSTTSAACSSSKVANGEADEESNAGTGEEEDDDGDADEDAEEAADAAPVEDAAPILLETLAPFLANRPSVDFLKASVFELGYQQVVSGKKNPRVRQSSKMGDPSARAFEVFLILSDGVQGETL